MQSTLTSVLHPRWANAEQTAIDCEITISQFGDELLPFTALQNDVEAHGRTLFADIVAGNYGPIAPYEAPVIDDETLAEAARLERDRLLTASDWTQGADVPQATKDRWAPYRQLLRDVPQQPGFPHSIVWPTQP